MTALVANLGMYDDGDLAPANDALWSAIARRLISAGLANVPEKLERRRSLEDIWSSGELLFGQTCGYPFAARFRGDLRLIATPKYSAPGCARDGHRSFIIVSARSAVRDLSALRGSRAVINEESSMTGRHLLGDAIATAGGALDFFTSVAISGSHEASLAKVAAEEADVAAIDCVSYAHLARAFPERIAEIRILHRTKLTPALPFVISAKRGEATARLVAQALADAIDDPSITEARRSLMLEGLTHPKPEIYERTLTVAANADRVFGSSVDPKSAHFYGTSTFFATGACNPSGASS